MALKVRLPNGRYIKVETDDPNIAKQEAIAYYNKGNKGFVDATTQQLGAQFDKKFDYETGVDATWLRTKLAAMETPAGKEKVLENAVGSKGFTRDSSGSLALTPEGLRTLGIVPKDDKYVVIDESGFSLNDFADFAGLVGPIAGSIAGSIFTRGKIKPKVKNIKTINLLDLGKISLGTGAGAAGGKTTEEAFEYMLGLQDNTPDELAGLAAQEFAIGAGAEFGLGVAGKLLKHTFGNRVLARAKEEPEVGRKLLLEASAASKGVYDPVTGKTYKGAVALAALESPIIGRLQPIIETIGDYKGRTDALSNLLFTDLKNLYRSTNDLSQNYNATFEDLQKLGFADASGDVAAGRAIKEKLQNSYNQSLKQSDKAVADINNSVNKIIGNFDAFKDPATTEAGAAIRSFTEQAYASWKKTSDELYDPLKSKFATRLTPEQLAKDLNISVEQVNLLPESALIQPIRFIDSTPIQAFATQLMRNGKVVRGLTDDDELIKDLAYLTRLGGDSKAISLDELLKVREELAGKLRITPEGKARFADLNDRERSELLEVINNVLKDLENGGSLVEALTASNVKARILKESKAIQTDDLRLQYIEQEMEEAIARGIINPTEVNQYLKLTRLANDFYSKGLNAFDRGVTKKIFNDAEGGGWNIDKVLTNILKKNNGEELKRFLDTLDASTAGLRKARIEGTKVVARAKAPERLPLEIGKEGRKLLKDLDLKIDDPNFVLKDQATRTLQKEFIRNITKNVADPTKPINFTKIANSIESYGTTGDVLFGGAAKKKALIQTLKDADLLANTGTVKEFEDLVTKSVDAEDLVASLKNKVSATEEISNIEKLDVFTKIQRGTIDPEEITSAIFKPANSDEVARVKNLLGEDSDLYKQFQLSAMRKILDNVVNPGEDAITKLFDEGAFARALDAYGDATLKETFGEEQFKLLAKARDRFRFIVGGERKAGGGSLFTQGFIFNFIFRPLQAVRVFTPIQALAWMMSRPVFVRWLAGEVSDKAMLKEAPSLLDYASRRLGVPLSPVLKPTLGVGLPRAFTQEGEEAVQRSSRMLGDPSAEAPLLEALPELRQEQQQRRQQPTLDLPELLPPLPATMQGARGPVPASLISDPITRDLANLLRQ
jgi:hypothetical protein